MRYFRFTEFSEVHIHHSPDPTPVLLQLVLLAQQGSRVTPLAQGVLLERSGRLPVSRDASRAAGVTLLGHVNGIATQAFITHGPVTQFVTEFSRELG